MTEQSAAKTLLLETDWAALSHAYGPAEDTPDRLPGLVSDSAEERMHAVEYLWTAILHQSSICSATPVVASFVAALLPNTWLTMPVSSVFGDELYPPMSTRARLLHFLGEVAQATGYDKADPEPKSACRAVAPALLQAAETWIGDTDPDVHDGAVFASVQLANLQANKDCSAKLADQLHAVAIDSNAEPHHRGICVLGLNELNVDTRSYLDCDSPVVRLCAALGNRSSHDERSLQELTVALQRVPDSVRWLDRWNPMLIGRLHDRLITVAAARAANFASIAATAIHVAQTVNHDTDLEPLLELAFPAWAGPHPEFDEDRKAFLRALANNNAIWNASHFMSLEQALEERALPSSQHALKLFIAS